jgi:hypothetical protein
MLVQGSDATKNYEWTTRIREVVAISDAFVAINAAAGVSPV